MTKEQYIAILDETGGQQRAVDQDFTGINMESLSLSSTQVTDSKLVNGNFSMILFNWVSIVRSTFNKSTFKDCELVCCTGGNNNFSETVFERCQFSEVTLPKSNFSKAVFLPRCDFKVVDFLDCLFTGAVFANLKVENCKFINVDFSRADLSGTVFINTDLTGAKFDQAIIENTRFENCKIDGVKFDKSLRVRPLPELADGEYRIDTIDRSKLAGANLTSSNFSQHQLSQVDFSNAILNGVNFFKSDLSSSVFTGVKMSNSNLSRIDGTFIIINKAVCSGSNFEKSKLIQAEMIQTDFTKSSFLEADLSGTNFKSANLSQTNFAKANLEGADFSGANLTGANFTGAKLDGANFELANLSGADFSGVDFENIYPITSNFKLAKIEKAINFKF